MPQRRSCHGIFPRCDGNMFLLLIIFFIIVILFTSPASSGKCSRTSSYRVSYRRYERCSSKRKVSYQKSCGFLSLGRCTKYRYKTVYSQCSSTRYKYRSRTVYYCCSGWTGGSSCSTPICSSSCLNGRCSRPGHCSCSSGYTGRRCETPICSSSCLNGGRCSRPGHCSCSSGYTGRRCETPICSSSCLNGGRCSRPGHCSCNSGYTGRRCETPICPSSCLNGGRCSRPGYCSCRSGYTGRRCETPVCSPVCQHSGTCSSPGRCSCRSGYIGSRCETPICSPVCQHGGTCSSPGRCSCTSSYIGSRCETPVCSPVCQHGGTCSSPGSCSCTSSYIGSRCETSVCSPVCQHGGTCSSPGRCSCTSSYIGSRCETPVCSPVCQHGGTCSSPGRCSCRSGYIGSRCETPVYISCPEDITVPADYNSSYTTTVYWVEPLLHGGEDLVQTRVSDTGQKFYIGTTLVEYNVVEGNGTVVTDCSFNVTVVDTESPIIICPSDIFVFTDASIQPAVEWTTPNATDNSGQVNVNCSHNSGHVYPIGLTKVNCQAFDYHGNVDKCNFTIMIEGVNITCPDIIRTLIDKSATTSTVTWDYPEIIGGLDQINVTVNIQPGHKFPVGLTLIEYIVSGPGMTALTSCSFNIIVYDPDKPTLICPDDIFRITKKRKTKIVFWKLPDVLYFSDTHITFHSDKPQSWGEVAERLLVNKRKLLTSLPRAMLRNVNVFSSHTRCLNID